MALKILRMGFGASSRRGRHPCRRGGGSTFDPLCHLVLALAPKPLRNTAPIPAGDNHRVEISEPCPGFTDSNMAGGCSVEGECRIECRNRFRLSGRPAMNSDSTAKMPPLGNWGSSLADTGIELGGYLAHAHRRAKISGFSKAAAGPKQGRAADRPASRPLRSWPSNWSFPAPGRGAEGYSRGFGRALRPLDQVRVIVCSRTTL